MEIPPHLCNFFSIRSPRKPADPEKTRDSMLFGSNSRSHESPAARPKSRVPVKASTNDDARQSVANKMVRGTVPTHKIGLQTRAGSRKVRNPRAAAPPVRFQPTRNPAAASPQTPAPLPIAPHSPP